MECPDDRSLRNQLPTRSFHITRSMKAPKDNSPIDFAFMPKYEIMAPKQPEIMRIPLLPNNFFPPRRSEAHQEAIESVIRPEISTVSADSTHIASPSAMSEVTDNHAIDLDPYDLTSKVTAAAAKMAGMPVEKLKAPGTVQEIWDGFLDDLLGSKKLARI